MFVFSIDCDKHKMDFNTSQPHYEPGVIKIYSQDFGEMQKQLTRLSNEVLELRKRVEHLEAKTKSPVVVDELGYTSRHPQLVVAQDQFRVIGTCHQSDDTFVGRPN